MTVRQSQCEICNRYSKGYCTAFEGSPPLEIFNNEYLHDEPYEGDGGILFMRNIDRKALFSAIRNGTDKEYRESLEQHPFRKRMENTVNDDTVGEIGYSGVTGHNYDYIDDDDIDKADGAVGMASGGYNARYGEEEEED